MEPIERRAFLEREFGIWIDEDEDCFTGILVMNHSFINLIGALSHLIWITTQHEFSNICIHTCDRVSIIINTAPPLCIEMDECHQDEVTDLLNSLTEFEEWRITDEFDGIYVLCSIEIDWDDQLQSSIN